MVVLAGDIGLRVETVDGGVDAAFRLLKKLRRVANDVDTPGVIFRYRKEHDQVLGSERRFSTGSAGVELGRAGVEESLPGVRADQREFLPVGRGFHDSVAHVPYATVGGQSSLAGGRLTGVTHHSMNVCIPAVTSPALNAVISSS